MGYCIDQDELLVKIPVNKRSELLAVFKKLREERDRLGNTSRGPGKKVYQWADEFEYSEDIASMFDAFRYNFREEGGFYIIDQFEGEKLGQDFLLWERIKPLVTEDSVATFYGEDHAHMDFLE